MLISKKSGTLVWAKQEIDIWRIHFGGVPGGGHSQMMSKHSSLRYVVILKKNWCPSLSQSKNWFLEVCLGGPRGVGTTNYVKIFFFKISTADIKKLWHRKLCRSKNWCWGNPWRGRYPQTTSKYLRLKYLLTAKKQWHPSLSHSKIGFRGSIWKGA